MQKRLNAGMCCLRIGQNSSRYGLRAVDSPRMRCAVRPSLRKRKEGTVGKRLPLYARSGERGLGGVDSRAMLSRNLVVIIYKMCKLISLNTKLAIPIIALNHLPNLTGLLCNADDLFKVWLLQRAPAFYLVTVYQHQAFTQVRQIKR